MSSDLWTKASVSLNKLRGLMLGFLSDEKGTPSSLRLTAAYLVVFGACVFPAGLVLPNMAEYAKTYGFKAWESALILLGITKTFDGVLNSKLAKDAGAPVAPNDPTLPA